MPGTQHAQGHRVPSDLAQRLGATSSHAPRRSAAPRNPTPFSRCQCLGIGALPGHTDHRPWHTVDGTFDGSGVTRVTLATQPQDTKKRVLLGARFFIRGGVFRAQVSCGDRASATRRETNSGSRGTGTLPPTTPTSWAPLRHIPHRPQCAGAAACHTPQAP